jgi:hypothetical protein
LVTRDGRTVTEFHRFETDTSNYPCRAVIDGSAFDYTKKGEFHKMIDDHEYDLFLAPTEVTMWQNIYAKVGIDGFYSDGFLWDSENKAKEYAAQGCIATVPVTFNTWKP